MIRCGDIELEAACGGRAMNTEPLDTAITRCTVLPRFPALLEPSP